MWPAVLGTEGPMDSTKAPGSKGCTGSWLRQGVQLLGSMAVFLFGACGQAPAPCKSASDCSLQFTCASGTCVAVVDKVGGGSTGGAGGGSAVDGGTALDGGPPLTAIAFPTSCQTFTPCSN